MKIKAISLWQPWASLIALGEKKFETRSWPTNYRGLLAIHAARRWTKVQQNLLRTTPFTQALGWYTDEGDPPLGCIVAVAELTDCFLTEQVSVNGNEYAFGDWAPGRFAWCLENVRRLPVPVPWKGRQGFFDVELELP